MSRLDRHVANVQNKLAMQTFLLALAWALLGLGVLVALGILVWRFLGFEESEGKGVFEEE